MSSGDEIQNKVNVLSTSQHSNDSNNDQLRCEVVRDLKVCYSTPIASNYIPPINLNGTVDGMSYALSPVGYQPSNPSVAQHAGFITQMDYWVKIDNLAQKIDQLFLKLNKLDQIESKINSFEKQVKAVTSDDPITDLDLITEFDFLPNCEVSMEHLQRVRHAIRGRLHLWTPGPVPLWDLQVFLC